MSVRFSFAWIAYDSLFRSNPTKCCLVLMLSPISTAVIRKRWFTLLILTSTTSPICILPERISPVATKSRPVTWKLSLILKLAFNGLFKRFYESPLPSIGLPLYRKSVVRQFKFITNVQQCTLVQHLFVSRYSGKPQLVAVVNISSLSPHQFLSKYFGRNETVKYYPFP